MSKALHDSTSDTIHVLGTPDLEDFIRTHSVRAEIISLSVDTPTVELAAKAVGASPDQIVKSLLFLVNSEPLLVIARGLEHVDRRAIGRHMNVGRKRVSLADPEAVLSLSGYPVGALPPFGHRTTIRTVVDRNVPGLELIFAGGGSPRALVRLEPAELVRVCGAELADLRLASKTGEA